MTLILGVWSFFLKAFFDYSPVLRTGTDFATSQPFGFSYIVPAAGLSSLILALWRWYVRYLDDSIAKLYPEIMLYEHILGVPSDSGITEYISHEKQVGEALSGLCQDQQRQIVCQLVKDKHIGRRGHLPLDIIVFVSFSIFVLIATADIWNLSHLGMLSDLLCLTQIRDYPILASKWGGYLMIACGLVIECCVFRYFQKNPSKKYIDKVKKQLIPPQS